MGTWSRVAFVCALLAVGGRGLDNGLARTPPMGWMAGQRFTCNTDCVNYPNDCISEALVKSQARQLISRDLHLLGYRYVLLGDCWQSRNRSKTGHLQADSKRFPAGIPALTDYLHKKGLLLGLYTGAGHFTPSGRPGSKGNYQRDASTFSEWGVDMVVLDGFNVSDVTDLSSDFVNFGQFMNKTGRHILYSCIWPLYEEAMRKTPDYGLVARTCNTFRSHKNMGDGWPPLEDIMKYFGNNPNNMSAYAGPGHWNDADQLVIGDYGLSEDQQRIQMALWSMLSSPLFISADLRSIAEVSLNILRNKALLAINQDSLGDQGRIILVKGQVYIWRKRLLPTGSFALMFIYVSISGGPTRVEQKLSDIGLVTSGKYVITDAITGQTMGTYKPWYTFNCEVNPTGVRIFTAIVRS